MKEESKQKKQEQGQYVNVKIQKIKKQQHQDRKTISPFSQNSLLASVKGITPLKGSKLNSPIEVQEEMIEVANR